MCLFWENIFFGVSNLEIEFVYEEEYKGRGEFFIVGNDWGWVVLCRKYGSSINIFGNILIRYNCFSGLF